MTYDPASIPERLNTRAVFNLAFQLGRDENCTVPSEIEALAQNGEVPADLGLGVHYFYTAVERASISWAALEDFVHLTDATQARHRFVGESLSQEEEEANALSNRFGRLLGIGFAAQFLRSTWFHPLAKAGITSVDTAAGRLIASRADGDDSWPDYLAASFEPGKHVDPALGALYALEFKGSGSFVKFEHQRFQKWIHQSRNIDLKLEQGAQAAINSWVIAFNYRCRDARERHESSTLLVNDPRVGPKDAHLPKSADPIIRQHLARQCRKLGLSGLAPYLVAGLEPPFPRGLPRVYEIDHPLLRGRRYVGNFVQWGTDGELQTVPPPPLWQGPGRLPYEWHGEYFSRHGNLRVRVDVDGNYGPTEWPAMHPYQPMLPFPFSPLDQVEHRETFFVGQDAGMLRECFSTKLDAELGGEVFKEPLEVSAKLGSDDDQAPGVVQVIRSGSVLASTSRIRPPGDDGFWHTHLK